ncbi:thiamine/thiamine pyrophosphate ABC transporter permease [Mesorhizobium xinjiangense]|uniref:thiamine/thiamine pyrophosphate ABC transporter permease n=1 Tax=Mesorhizobium xinjiangense TaxID=2678685 RepID=UPI0012ED9720|nr:thiamine/thiamine pyrophosphate ABC transporter permease [Mesorhizobium xinjiangense]
MAVRDEPLTRPRGAVHEWRGLAGLAFIGLLIGGALLGLVAEGARDPSGARDAFDPYLARVVRFTLLQAILSTLASVLPAIVVARALSRHGAFRGRGLLLRLFSVPLALPQIVAALGVLALFGRAGLLADLASASGLGHWPSIYGLSGILIAHAFFNVPLAARLLLQALDTIPADHWRLASQLGMAPWSTFGLIEWPAMRAALPGIAGLVFMLCVTSFTIVLTLGGGPAATTLEVAIYQALRFDFDPARALVLTALQLGLTIAIVWLLARLGADLAGETSIAVSRRRYAAIGGVETLFNAAVLMLALAFVGGPIAAIVAGGLEADLGRLIGEHAVRAALATSLVLAFVAAILCCLLTFGLVSGRKRLEARRRSSPAGLAERLMDSGTALVLVVPPIIIGAGWFLLLRLFADAFAFAPVMVVCVNAVMAIPFVVRAIRPAHDSAFDRHDRLCRQLGITGMARLRLVDWPVMRRPLATGFAFAMALSIGDLGVIALFGSEQVQTLPYLLLARMSSYRTADAAGIALILAVFCFLLIMLAERLGGEKR